MSLGEDEHKQVWTVSELNSHIRNILFSSPELRSLWVAGEVSNYSSASSGHCYFTLKDSQSSLRCVMFRRHAKELQFDLTDGMDIVAFGNIDVYERNGQYQLYVREINPSGVGALYISLQQLRERLREEGLFEQETKRSLPGFPQTIGVVTSRHSAAFRDIVKVVRRRSSGCNIVLAHSSVQGLSSSQQLVSGLNALQKDSEIEVLILARGGGSLEDLQAFNDEDVVRAVSESNVPVVTGVGHESDVTLCGLAADARGATPSAAAELVVPDREELFSQIEAVMETLSRRLSRLLHDKKRRLQVVMSRRSLQRPQDILQGRKQTLDSYSQELIRSQDNILQRRSHQLRSLKERLEAMNPQTVLKRGYSIVRDNEGRIVSGVGQVEVSQGIKVLLNNGELDAEVVRIKPEK